MAGGPAADTAGLFAPDVISAGDASCPAFTPDGRTVFFMREAGGDYTILTSNFDGTAWSAPVVAPFSGAYADIDPFVTPDGSSVIFASRRPLPGSDSTLSVFQLWAAPLDGAVAGDAAPFGPPPDLSLSRFFATLTRDGTAYFAQRVTGGTTGNDIYRSARVGDEWTAPTPVDALNTEHSDSNPLISPDGQLIVFFSSRPGGLGNSDLYVSFSEGTTWTPPRNLGAAVNTPDSENCPALSPDGQTLYFARGVRNADGQVVSRNIYFIRAAAALSRE